MVHSSHKTHSSAATQLPVSGNIVAIFGHEQGKYDDEARVERTQTTVYVFDKIFPDPIYYWRKCTNVHGFADHMIVGCTETGFPLVWGLGGREGMTHIWVVDRATARIRSTVPDSCLGSNCSSRAQMCSIISLACKRRTSGTTREPSESGLTRMSNFSLNPKYAVTP
jgi:hypothetical protein